MPFSKANQEFFFVMKYGERNIGRAYEQVS
jgi:hypothetical protein